MKIRSGFVSNSSSSSFIVIGTDITEKNLPLDDGKFIIGSAGETEFGWQNTTYEYAYDRINFAWMQANYMIESTPEWMEMLGEVIKEHTGATEVVSIINLDWPRHEGEVNGYIDHQSASCEGVNTEMFADKDTLARFLFGSGSYIQGGNDNE